MEEVRQDDAFVRKLLERVLHLLYITLQDRACAMPTLHHELGLSDAHRVPVSSHLPPGTISWSMPAENMLHHFLCVSLLPCVKQLARDCQRGSALPILNLILVVV